MLGASGAPLTRLRSGVLRDGGEGQHKTTATLSYGGAIWRSQESELSCREKGSGGKSTRLGRNLPRWRNGLPASAKKSNGNSFNSRGAKRLFSTSISWARKSIDLCS